MPLAYDWTNEKTLKLIELLADEPAIWDPKHKHHKLKHKVRDAWDRLEEAMNIPIKELKDKKKSLMASFRPLVHKKKASLLSGSSADEVYQPQWFAYDAMESFLGTIYDVCETISLSDQESAMSPTTSTQRDVQKPTQIFTETVTNTETTPIPKKRTKKMHSILVETEKTKKNDDTDDERMNTNFVTCRVIEDKKVEEDQCDAYAKLLAMKLRKYPERMRDHIMYKIDGLLLDNPYPDAEATVAVGSVLQCDWESETR